MVKLTPNKINFKIKDSFDFDSFLSALNWDLKNESVEIDFSESKLVDYQALALFVPYLMYLKNQNCKLEIKIIKDSVLGKMWDKLDATKWDKITAKNDVNFSFHKTKPFLAIRSYEDVKRVIHRIENYTKNFHIEYEKTLRYIISELLYNTIEHGHNENIPSFVQFSNNVKVSEISFVIADTGVGIKEHLKKAYPGIESDIDAIKLAIKPQVSGTFIPNSPYQNGNNAGMGLFISTNIVKKLYSDIYIISGHGQVHISPTDITEKRLENSWHGTLVYVNLRFGKTTKVNLEQVMHSLREEAEQEIKNRDSQVTTGHYLNIKNYFGGYAEDKGEAINYRDKYLVANAKDDKDLILDFADVVNSPHSFLNALLSIPIKIYGMKAYKKIKVKNAQPNIRETIDFILDDLTRE
ncbi:MAG TPA: ATP-binding protein [Leptospiraceae bacterium]|nr:ATP-binding protein [Leptospiraceae bacterium]HMW06637.1 ATP-binding protein [Leptospiraceae bacterium]HMX34269.1 ATP-binding protein [Leptospiraceae bacterium]HMY32702.1 ATP-binding protein [Leptospiraceae bacterium]HMZ64892.1 ATP-binding protein [Leptospiraceae bacterium]